jgi:hypothetical protein
MRVNKIFQYYQNLSQREKLLVIGGVLVLAPLFINTLLIKPIYEKFKAQTAALAQLESDIKTVPFILDRYRRFAAKKTDLENEFKQVEIKEGEQSLLENIVSGKVDPGFDITAGQTRNFGGSYEQAAFTVRFSISSLSTLVDLLKEITTGAKRMLLTSLTISKDPSGEKLRVEISVSSIRQIKSV